MAAAVTAARDKPVLYHDKERTEDPPVSGFTAVNGRVSPTQSVNTNKTSDDKDRSPPRPSPENRAPLEEAPLRSETNASPRGQETGVRGGPATAFPGRRNDSVVSSPGKRKRSGSDLGIQSNPKHTRSEPEHQPRADSAESGPRDGSMQGHSQDSDVEVDSASEASHPYHPADANGTRQSWYNREHWDAGGPNGHNMDRQMRDPYPSNSEQDRNRSVARREEMGEMHQGPAEYKGERTAAGVIVDHKKRKRVFSNRTKTGCQTCRRRKKKCDEGKPSCANCFRGGFTCEGYATKATWAKPGLAKPPVLLQAKDGYGEHPNHSHNSGGYPEQSQMHAPASRGRHSGGDDDRDQHSSRAAWPDNKWSELSRPSYLSEHLPRTDYSRVPPLSELSRNQRDEHHGSSENHRRPSTHHYPSPDGRRMSNSQSTAQLALQYQNGHHQVALRGQQPGAAPAPQAPRPSEKDKMIRGYRYQPFCPTLIDDRELCKANLWRFNEVNNPIKAISQSERELKFRAILESGLPRTLPGRGSGPDRVGTGVRVEAPFTCEFGYNIEIGCEVVISANCTIMDAAAVHIGSGSFLGPNVSVYTSTLSTDPQYRAVPHREAEARPVIIGENVFIAGSVTILPGIRIGKNSTVGAGSVVTKDVPPDVVAYGNPARVRYDAPGSDTPDRGPNHNHQYLPSSYPSDGYPSEQYNRNAGSGHAPYHQEGYRPDEYRHDDRHYEGGRLVPLRANGPSRAPPARGIEARG